MGQQYERLVQPLDCGEQDGACVVTVGSGKLGAALTHCVAIGQLVLQCQGQSPQREITVSRGACPASQQLVDAALEHVGEHHRFFDPQVPLVGFDLGDGGCVCAESVRREQLRELCLRPVVLLAQSL